MHNVITQLADVKFPADLLEQVDIGEVFQKFHTTFKRLDDFKNIRDKHEQRGVLGRLFNRGELKNAQLDAQEVQAEFSKTLAQLMMISTMQSQQLVNQQRMLSHQQDDLAAKAEALAKHNQQLEKHQATIQQQAADLKKFVTDLLNVQGLTEEHGQKLILVAEEIFKTRDNLLNNFDTRMFEVSESLRALRADNSAQLGAFAEDICSQRDQFEGQLLDRQTQSEHRQAQLHTELSAQLEQTRTRLTEESVAGFAQVQEQLNERSEQLTNQQHEAQQQLTQSQEQLKSALTRTCESLHQHFSGALKAQAELTTSKLSELSQTNAQQTRQLEAQAARSADDTASLNAALESLRSEQTNAETTLRKVTRNLLMAVCLLAVASATGIAYTYMQIKRTDAAISAATVVGHKEPNQTEPADAPQPSTAEPVISQVPTSAE